jgi:2-iminobutanoate/2-iminopropanoate deaminase
MFYEARALVSTACCLRLGFATFHSAEAPEYPAEIAPHAGLRTTGAAGQPRAVGDRRVISSSDAPAAIGPYSQAVVAGGMVYCSGQIALDPGGELVGQGDVAAQTRQVLSNLEAVLKAAGSNFSKVVKATIFLADMGDFATVNEIYGAAVGTESPPARATVEVSRLPKDVRVEIDAIALVD